MQMVILGESPLSYIQQIWQTAVHEICLFYAKDSQFQTKCLFYYIILLHVQFITLDVCYTVFINMTDVLKKCLFCVLVPRLPDLIMQRRWWIKLLVLKWAENRSKRRKSHEDPHLLLKWKTNKRKMVVIKVRAWIHYVIQMTYCYIIHLPFWSEPTVLIGLSLAVHFKTVVDEWLDCYKRSRETGLLVLINFIVQSCGCKGQRSRWSPPDEWWGGSEFKRLSFQFQLRRWSAVNYWSSSMVTMQRQRAVLMLRLLTTGHVNILREWNENEKKS